MGNTQTAKATWTGSLKEGKGTFSLPKAQFNGSFTHATRFQNENGSNPEELVGAAIASCFSMFLAATIGKHNYTVNDISTTADVVLDVLESGPEITAITLTVQASAEQLSEDNFSTFVAHSKENCPISKLYKGTSITVNATLN